MSKPQCSKLVTAVFFLTMKTLAVTGRDLIQAGYKPGPELGEILNRLLEHVLDVPEDNTKEKLMSLI